MKVLRHLGGQRLSHKQLHPRSGWEEQALPLPWHHIPCKVLRAAPAPSFLGFFLHRTKEDVKTCGTCGHRFGAELLLPKGKPSVPSLCTTVLRGKRAEGVMELRCQGCPIPTVPRPLEEPPAQPSAHYYVTSYGTTTFGPSSIQVTKQVRTLLPPLAQGPTVMGRLLK